MIGETRERWRDICEEARLEPDPSRLLKLRSEINRLAQLGEQRLPITIEQSLISSASGHEFL
jgi:hypothetical protein